MLAVFGLHGGLCVGVLSIDHGGGAAAPVWRDLPPAVQVQLISQPARPGKDPLALPVPTMAWGSAQWIAPPQLDPLERTSEVPDRAALPLTAPDLSALMDMASSGNPIRLRLHIDATGRVVRAEVLDCVPEDLAFANAFARALLRTPHMPARAGGKDVASTKDIVLSPKAGV